MKGLELKRVLKELGKSQLKFAKEVGIPHRTVQNWLSSENENKHLVNTENSLKILKYLSYEAFSPSISSKPEVDLPFNDDRKDSPPEEEELPSSGYIKETSEEVDLDPIKKKITHSVKLACDFTPFYSILCLFTLDNQIQQEERFSKFLEKLVLKSDVDISHPNSIFQEILKIAHKAAGNTEMIAAGLSSNSALRSLINEYFEKKLTDVLFVEYDPTYDVKKFDLVILLDKIEAFEKQAIKLIGESIRLKTYLKQNLRG